MDYNLHASGNNDHFQENEEIMAKRSENLLNVEMIDRSDNYCPPSHSTPAIMKELSY